MQVFLSYSAADRKLADRLREELSRDGISVWDSQGGNGTDWNQQLEKAIGAADDILILVGARSRDDKAQQLTWQLALEAAWRDSHKRLIPILLRDAALPPFVFGDAAGDETRVVRILDPRDVRGAAQAIRGALQRNGQEASRGISEEVGSGSIEVTTKGSFAVSAKAKQRDRLEELEKFAERLKQQ